jgi:hypothetical protein
MNHQSTEPDPWIWHRLDRFIMPMNWFEVKCCPMVSMQILAELSSAPKLFIDFGVIIRFTGD